MTLGVQVFDGATLVAEYTTIQAAINSATTLDGYTLRVIEADYNPGVSETVTVTKELTFETDTNVGIDPNTGTRLAEVVVDRFEVQADNVTIDGFTVSGTSNEERVEITNGADNVAVLNSIVVQDGSTTGIVVQNGSINAQVANNSITQNAGSIAVRVEGASDISSNVVQVFGIGILLSNPDTTYSVTDNNIQSSSVSNGDAGIFLSGFFSSLGVVSGNSVAFTQAGSLGTGLRVDGNIRNLTIQNNVAYSGGAHGIEITGNSGFNQSTVVISEDVSAFSGQSVALILLESDVEANGIVIDEAALVANGGIFARSDAPDSTVNNQFDGGLAYFADLQTAIDTSLNLATIGLSPNYGNTGAITVTREGLTIDAPSSSITGSLTLDTGI